MRGYSDRSAKDARPNGQTADQIAREALSPSVRAANGVAVRKTTKKAS